MFTTLLQIIDKKPAKYILLPKVLNYLVCRIKTGKFMMTYDGAKKDEYNMEDEKDLNEENYGEPKRFLLVDCIEDDQRIVIFPSGLQ